MTSRERVCQQAPLPATLDAVRQTPELAALRAARPGPKRVAYHFEHTDAWEQVARETTGGRQLGPSDDSSERLLEELRSRGVPVRRILRGAMLRALARDVAARSGVLMTEALSGRAMEKFFRERGLVSEAQVEASRSSGEPFPT